MIYDFKNLLLKHGIEGNLLVWQDKTNKKLKIAKQLFEKYVQDGELRIGQTVTEASAGSMAAAISKITMEYGMPFVAFTFEHVKDKLCTNSTLISPPPEEEMFPMLIFQREAEAYAKNNDAFYFNQFGNQYHWQCYKNWGKEIMRELTFVPDCYIDKAGTGATLRGFGEAFIEAHPDIEVLCVDNPGIPYIGFLKDFNFKKYRVSACRISDEAIDNLASDLLEMYGITRLNNGRGSIISALHWLMDNPGKTVFTTIGD